MIEYCNNHNSRSFRTKKSTTEFSNNSIQSDPFCQSCLSTSSLDTKKCLTRNKNNLKNFKFPGWVSKRMKDEIEIDFMEEIEITQPYTEEENDTALTSLENRDSFLNYNKCISFSSSSSEVDGSHEPSIIEGRISKNSAELSNSQFEPDIPLKVQNQVKELYKKILVFAHNENIDVYEKSEEVKEKLTRILAFDGIIDRRFLFDVFIGNGKFAEDEPVLFSCFRILSKIIED